jgi:hypothetical protein
VQSEAASGALFKSREVSNHGGLGRPIETKVRLFQREPLCPSASMSREIDAAFATFGAERPDALFVSPPFRCSQFSGLMGNAEAASWCSSDTIVGGIKLS